MKDKLCILSIAGSDCGAGAGIQGDLKTFSSLGAFGLTALTLITAQNTKELCAVQSVNKRIVHSQLEALFYDFPIRAVKIGIIPNKGIGEVIRSFMQKYRRIPWVIDPVIEASVGGKSFLSGAVLNFLKTSIVPLSSLITPNILELERLTKKQINNEEDIKKLSQTLFKDIGKVPILVKGGHSTSFSKEEKIVKDILYDGKRFSYFYADRIKTINSHGTGCALSSAIAVYLGEGNSLDTAIKKAKIYLTGALENTFSTGKGNGSINHFWNTKT